MSIDGLCLGLYQQTLSVGTDYIAVDGIKLDTLGCCHIEEHTRLLTSLERIQYDATSVATQLCIALTIVQRCHGSHRFPTECPVRNVFQVKVSSSH